MWRRRAPRRVRQKLGRVWRDHPRIAPLRHLGRRSLSLGRYGLRGVLSARHAGSIARTDWGWELDREVVAAARSGQKHSDGSGKVVNALAMAASYDPDPTQF